MARRSERLTEQEAERLTRPGKYADGNGLYLQINPMGAKSWVLRYELFGRERNMGLGPFRDVSLLDARSAASRARRSLGDGVDPLDKRRQQIERRRDRVTLSMTFDACAKQYIEDHGAAWRSEKHRAQWEATLRTYVSPRFGAHNVRRINTEHVLKALEPIWRTKTVTATRVRERVERVLSWAAVRGFRDADNPARWNGHLEMLLPPPSKLRKAKHHAALPVDQASAFLQRLRECDGTAARALEFTVLTASRSGEAVGARWSEIDLVHGTWTVPAVRMKAGRVHRVPLTEAAVELLERQVGLDPEFVFPGAKKGQPLSATAMPMVLRRLRRDDLTVHGFRSTFRDWAAEMTDHPCELAEVALAHTVGSAVENAYRRGDMLQRRRRLMEDWASWCGAARRPTVSSGVAKAPTVNLSFQLAPLSCQALTLTASLSLGQDTARSGNSLLPMQFRGALARSAENVLLAR